ncbi:MAG: DUF1326 domain-containing protein [Gammaproteobacteria bacterium]
MASIDWRIQGIDVTTCNCAWGCPCQFMSLPTHGNCLAAVGFHIDRGHFGPTSLDGLSFAGLFAWPKAIHEGNGEAQPIVDVRASAAQREAVLKIMSGEETEPGATIFNVFAATFSKVHEPLFKRIEIKADLATCTARLAIEDVVDARVDPIRNPVTGQRSAARIVLPAGFEYEEAECGSSEVSTLGSPISFQWQGRHAHLAMVDLTGSGVVRKHAA